MPKLKNDEQNKTEENPNETAQPQITVENNTSLKSKQAETTRFVYVGPTLPGGRIRHGAVLIGTLSQITECYKEEVSAYPQIAKLIIPVSRLGLAQKQIKSGGNALSNFYTEVEKQITTIMKGSTSNEY